MNKIQNIIWISALLLAVAACSGGKKIAAQKDDQQSVAVDTAQLQLDEQKQMEFDYLFLEALKQKMFGNPQNAIQILSSCLEINPNSSAAMYELAGIHAANNDFTSASLLLEKAISIDNENKWYKELLAQVYQQTRKFSEAAGIYEQMLKNDPENLELLYKKALVLTNAKEYQKAIETYDVMEKIAGINEQISVAKQQLYVLNNQPEKAFDEINKLIEHNPSEPKYFGLKADLYQNLGDSVKALENYKKILEMDPESGFVHFSLANYYLEQNKPEKSYSETLKGFSNDEVDLQTKLQFYMMLVSNKDKSKISPEQEKQLIEILKENYPDEFLVYTVYADYLLRKNELGEARQQFLKAIELENNDYMVWERVLLIDNDLQQWDSLYEHSQQALEFFPNQPQVYLLLAVASLQLEKLDETIEVATEGMDYVVDNPPLKAQLIMLQGEAEYKLGNLDQAFELFDQSVKLNPDNYIGLNNYAYYLSVAGRDLDKAERMSGRVVEKFPDNATYLDTHAWVLFKKGEYTLAKFYMEAAIKNGGEENATLLEHYGDILFMLKKLDEAKKYWEKAKSLGGASAILDRKIQEQKYFEE